MKSLLLILATALTSALLIAAPAGDDAVKERSSKDDEHFARILEKFPQSDTDKDGVLTMEEALAFKPKLDEWRKKQQALKQGPTNRPKPTHADVKYGPHERNVFDLWLPEGANPDKPVPVFFYFHGGGFVAGDKSRFDPRPYLDLGYAAASGNYRFVNGEDVISPVPMQDSARAVQFLRHKSKDFGIDPKRIALSGGSAGAVITMWIAYKDDMAKPKSKDPVERQSTRVNCIVPVAGPTNLDPVWIHKNLGGPKSVHSSIPKFYGIEEGDYDNPETRKLAREASAVHHATKDDPPTFMVYAGELDNIPLPANASQGLLIHHPHFGKVLKDKLDKLGVENEFHYGRNRPDPEEIAEFLAKHL